MDKIYDTIIRLTDNGEALTDMQVTPPDQYIMQHAGITDLHGTTYKYLLDNDTWLHEYKFYYKELDNDDEIEDKSINWNIVTRSIPLDERLRLSLTGIQLLKEQITTDLNALDDYAQIKYAKEISGYKMLVQEIDAVMTLIDYYTTKGTISTQTMDAAISLITDPYISDTDYPQQVHFTPELKIGNVDDDWRHENQDSVYDFLTEPKAFLDNSEDLIRSDKEEYWSGSYYNIENDIQMILTILHFCQSHNIKMVKCRTCGKVFIVTPDKRKYCSDECREIGDKANKKAYDERNKAEKRAKQRLKKYYSEHMYDFPIEILRLPKDIDPIIERKIKKAVQRRSRPIFNADIRELFRYQKEQCDNGVLSEKDYNMWLETVGKKIK